MIYKVQNQLSFLTAALIALTLLLPLTASTQPAQRCQQSSILQTAASSRYQVSNNGTVLDKNTGLLWRQCAEGLSGKNCEQGQILKVTWAEALRFAPKINQQGGFAGSSDWRLPNIRELNALVELQCVDPTINSAVFPNTPSTHFWSASPSRFLTDYSWYTDFAKGGYNHDQRILLKAVRLVRGNSAGKQE